MNTIKRKLGRQDSRYSNGKRRPNSSAATRYQNSNWLGSIIKFYYHCTAFNNFLLVLIIKQVSCRVFGDRRYKQKMQNTLERFFVCDISWKHHLCRRIVSLLKKFGRTSTFLEEHRNSQENIDCGIPMPLSCVLSSQRELFSRCKQRKMKINREGGQGRAGSGSLTTHVSSLGKGALHYFRFIKYNPFLCWRKCTY